MNWRPIATKDAGDGIRSVALWLTTGVFVLLFGGLAGFVWHFGDRSATQYLGLSVTLVVLLVPLLAVVLGYKAVISEVSSGSIALLLSLPHSRGDLAVGTFVGRAVVIAVPVLAALLAGGVIGLVALDGSRVLDYVGYVALSALLGVSFLGVALGLSLSSKSSRRVTAGAFGVYLLFVVLWGTLVELTWLVIYRFQVTSPLDRPDWSFLLELLSPIEAYRVILDVAVAVEFTTIADVPGAPGFVTWWMALAILVGWMFVPVLLGYLRFTKAELT